ncbi:FliH/SctL family protein [Allosphingosinicella sp.]|uniref:FliH/SctL family protein n=1 Tax=Allosphingosinicella sp. TaxID=2823234 RepID=UPI002FC1B33E
MSNLWSREYTASAASVGSFALDRSLPMFTPWGASDEAPRTANDRDEAQPDAAATHADSFAQGFDAGRRTAELEFAGERQVIARLAEQLEELRPEPSSALAALIAETVERLVTQIVGSVDIDKTLLQQRAEIAAKLIGEDTEPAKLRVHPDDIALLEPARIPVSLVGDASLRRGSIMLDTGDGWIEDGPAVRLERLRAALDSFGTNR